MIVELYPFLLNRKIDRYLRTGKIHLDKELINKKSGLPKYHKSYHHKYNRLVNTYVNRQISKLKQEKIDLDTRLQNLQNTLKTRNSNFYFDFIVANYDPDINPVKALFNDIQKVLLFEEDFYKIDFFYTLFNDQEWVDQLIDSIIEDKTKILQFMETLPDDIGSISKNKRKKISKLFKLSQEFDHYIVVFKSLKQNLNS